MALIRLDSLERALKKLPHDVQTCAKGQIARIEENSRDPRLHIKKLGEPFKDVFSFRITRNLEVFGPRGRADGDCRKQHTKKDLFHLSTPWLDKLATNS